jgi:hypothetical protein
VGRYRFRRLHRFWLSLIARGCGTMGPVASESFSYRARKSGSVAISWRGRTVAILTGSAARRFLDRMRDASPSEAQLEMARVTGNFKRGNEG